MSPSEAAGLSLVEHDEGVSLVIGQPKGMVEFLTEEGYVSRSVRVYDTVRAEDVHGRNVIGDLPLEVAESARSVTRLLTARPVTEDMTAEQIREVFIGTKRYSVSPS